MLNKNIYRSARNLIDSLDARVDQSVRSLIMPVSGLRLLRYVTNNNI